jgi:single-strand DNA-binding protein
MAGFNKVIVMGNLTKDPVLRQIPSGASVCDLAVASNRVYAVNGEKREQTLFIDVVVWNKQGEACAQYLSKGRPVLIEGRLEMESWEKDGQKRSKHVITAERVQFLGGGNGTPRPAGEPEDVQVPESDEVPF